MEKAALVVIAVIALAGFLTGDSHGYQDGVRDELERIYSSCMEHNGVNIDGMFFHCVRMT